MRSAHPQSTAAVVGTVSATVLALSVLAVLPGRASAQKELRVGWCAKTISAAAAPFAIATKLGWFAAEGIAVHLVPLAGSGECAKHVAMQELLASLTSPETVAMMRPLGVSLHTYYTAYQGNIIGMAVPRDSPIRTVADLRGKRIGLISMAQGGIIMSRALVTAHGMDPDRDVHFVVAGEGAQTAALLRAGQVDALSQFDTQFALVENAGVPLRILETHETDRFPSNGFIALKETLASRKKDLIGVARGYARGTIFAINNPQAAVRILWEVYPQTKPTGKDEETALRDDTKVLEARAVNWRLEKGGAKRWGENVEANHQAYMDFLLKWGAIKQPVAAKDLISNAWIDEINNFNPAQVAAEAKAYTPK